MFKNNGRDSSNLKIFSPLFQGLLTDKYLHGIPEGSRVSKPNSFLSTSDINEVNIKGGKSLKRDCNKTWSKNVSTLYHGF